MENLFHKPRRYMGKKTPENDNLGNLMQDYNFSIAIQENSSQVKIQGFILWIN
jgi:hypothetical protein